MLYAPSILPHTSPPDAVSYPRRHLSRQRRFPLGVRCCVLRVSGAFPKRETRNPNVTGGANDPVDWLNRMRIIHLIRGNVNRPHRNSFVEKEGYRGIPTVSSGSTPRDAAPYLRRVLCGHRRQITVSFEPQPVRWWATPTSCLLKGIR